MTVSIELVNTGNTHGDRVIVTGANGKRVALDRGDVLRLGILGKLTIEIVGEHGDGAWAGEIESTAVERHRRLVETDFRA